MFQNREEAARALADLLQKYKGENPIILAIPRGAVPMGKIIAEKLNAPLDVVLVRKIGAPFNPELAIGAVSEKGDIFLNDWAVAEGVTEDQIKGSVQEEMAVIKRRRELYLGKRPPLSLKGKTAIIVDDGIATGATVTAAVRFVRTQHPAKLIVAAAVVSPDTAEKLKMLIDELIVLQTPINFYAVGQFFEDFPQVTDEEVSESLKRANRKYARVTPSDVRGLASHEPKRQVRYHG